MKALALSAVLVAVAPQLAAAQAPPPPPPRPAYSYYSPGPYYAPPPPQAPVVHTYVRTPVWYMGLGVVGTSIIEQSGGPEELQGGGGLSLWAGLHLNQVLSLEVGWLGSFHNPATIGTWYGDDVDFLVLEGVTADARLHLSRGGGFDPYLQGGVGVYFLGSENFGMDSIGTGFQLGGGFDVWVGPAVTLGLRARYHGIAMGPPEGGQTDTFINAATIEGSIALHF